MWKETIAVGLVNIAVFFVAPGPIENVSKIFLYEITTNLNSGSLLHRMLGVKNKFIKRDVDNVIPH